MASTACSSTCITGGDLFVWPQALRKETRPLKLCGGVIVARKQHIFPIKAVQRIPIFSKEKYLEPEWINLELPGKSDFKAWYIGKQCRHIINAVATVDPFCIITSESALLDDSSLWFDSNPELDNRETLRRMRISKANKGNIPWNKGRKHSPETLQKIRERTKLAMQDPKVKMKLMNLGHAQSDETKKKISLGVSQGWQRRRRTLMIQDRCISEWQNLIAEASRKGYAGEVELQWDSFKVIDEQLKQMWLESIEKRKSMPRPKGSKRAPKSLEQRRKISEAISAKWADPVYRNRVHAALSKYHGTVVGSGKRHRTKSNGETSPEKSVSIRKKPEKQTAQLDIELKNFKQVTYSKRKKSAPSYKDPMSSANLELLKRIKADRAEMETKKREATMRARLLIAEAERAAEALEVAALKSPLAKASLLETRKLISEAKLSLKSIESGQLMSQENVEPYFKNNSDGSNKHIHTNTTTSINQVNGFHNLSSLENLDDEINQYKMRYGIESGRTETTAIDRTDSDLRKRNDSEKGSTRTRKWVCGRLVEVEE